MADTIIRLKVESKEYEGKLKRAVQGMQQLEKRVREMGASFEVAEKADLEFVRALGDMELQAKSVSGQTRELRDAILTLKQQYDRLTDEEKFGEWGEAMMGSIDRLKVRASNLKDEMGDLDEEIKHMASDTQFTDGVNLMASTIGSCAAAMTAWAADSKELEQVIRELAKITTTVKAVQDLTNAFQKQNMVLLKNPYVIAATAATVLAVAIGKIIKSSLDLSAVQKTLNEVEKKGREGAAEEIARINSLNSILHDNTRSLEERKIALIEIQNLVPDYHGSLTDEGNLINDNTTALDNYISGLQRAATAQAAFDKMVELQKRRMEQTADLQQKKNELAVANSRRESAQGSVIYAGSEMSVTYEQIDVSGAKRAVQNAEAAVRATDAEIQALQNLVKATDIVSNATGAKTGGGGTKTTTKTTTTSTTTKADTEKVKTATMLWEQYAAEIAETERLLAEFQAMAANIDLTDSQRDWAQGMADAYEEQLNKMKGVTEEAAEEIKTEIVDIKAEMEKLPSSFDMFKDGVDSIGTMVSALDNLKNIGEDLASVFRGDMDAWDSFMTVISAGVGIMETVISVIEAINVLTEISAMLKQKNAIAAASEAAAVATGGATQIATNTAVAATAGTAAAANAAEGSTAAGKAVAGIPVVGPLLAAAAIATVLGAMIAAISSSKSAGKFADGGIIPGNNYSGDMLTANVNAGELILNRAQQSSIASQLASSNPMGGMQLEALISGESLRLVLANNASRRGGSRGQYAITKFG